MPTTYAHDLFGKKVYQKLPGEMQELIRENKDLYRIGLHGPDILFYFFISKNPVTQFGVKMHKEKAAPFFLQGMEQVRKCQDRALLAYLLGFGCHYMLDSTCHPFVNKIAKEGVVTHTVLEKEFDRLLMIETGKDPYHFYPSDAVVPKKKYARVIHKAIGPVRWENIYLSLKMMKISTNAMVYDNQGRRRRFLSGICSLAGEKRAAFVMDHFMTEYPAPESKEPVWKLREYFDQALEEAPQYLTELYALASESGTLSNRWNQTYNG